MSTRYDYIHAREVAGLARQRDEWKARAEKAEHERDAIMVMSVRPTPDGLWWFAFAGWHTTTGFGWQSTTPYHDVYGNEHDARDAVRKAAGLDTEPTPERKDEPR